MTSGAAERRLWRPLLPGAGAAATATFQIKSFAFTAQGKIITYDGSTFLPFILRKHYIKF